MSKTIVSRLAAVVLMIAAVTPLSSLAGSGVPLSVKVPFDFVIQDKVFPAGEYTVERPLSYLPAGLLLRTRDGKALMFVQAQNCESLEVSAETRFVFHKYADAYYLSDIWTVGDRIGMHVPATHTEQRLSRITAQVDRSTITVEGNVR